MPAQPQVVSDSVPPLTELGRLGRLPPSSFKGRNSLPLLATALGFLFLISAQLLLRDVKKNL